jgi:GT2 family glycosyltransferase
MKKIIAALRHAKERPDWRRKFIKEVKDNGFKSAINKMKNKIHISHKTAFIPEPSILKDEKQTLLFPAESTPQISIIIPVYNNFNYTYLCLQSILVNTPNIPYEIIIADDNSSDETIDLDQYVKNVCIVKDGINRGFLLNCNNATQHARGKYILFLNNDTQVQPQWLSTLLELIESDEKIGMVGSKLVYPDGRLQEAGGIIWNDASGWNYGHLDDPMKPEYNYVKEVDYISGASLMIRKSLWKSIGGFDERYVPAYYEDSDLAFEVRKHGYKVVYQPKSVVIHFEGISNGTDLSSGIKQYQVINHEKFFNKWKDVLEKDHFPNAENIFLARDRSRDKKHILIIDHYVPHYDQDAGSRTVYGYIKFFISEGYSIKFIGDNFFQHEPYTSSLEKLGVEVLYGNWYFSNWQDWFKQNGSHFTIVFLNRPHISEKYIDFISQNSESKIWYYGHDLHCLRERREYDLSKKKEFLNNSFFWEKKEFSLMRKADISLYPSQEEVKYIHRIDKSINVQAIPAYLFEHFISSEYNERTKDIIFIGGFKHTPNIDGALWFVREIWPLILSILPDLKFYILGSHPTQEIQQLDNNINIFVTGFVSDGELLQYYKNARIVIVPLRFGAGVKGKVVEALFNEKPIITTSIGAEGLDEAAEYMIIKDDPSEFAQSVIELYQNDEMLKKYSQFGKTYCQKYFSFEAAAKKLNNIME